MLEILVNQKNKILVNGSYFQTVKEIRPTILDFIKERKSYSRIIITINSKSTDLNIDNDIVNLLTSCLIKQNITPKQGMIYFNPEDLWKIWEKEVKPPPPPPEIPEKIEIEWEDEEELENELEVDNAEADQDKMMEMPEEAFMSVEKMPIFKDSCNLNSTFSDLEQCTQHHIMKFISRNFKYPEISKANGVEGRVILEFVVEKDGRVGRVKILRGLDKYIDKAAIEAVRKLPKFSPGRQIGKAVPVKYTVPIKCTLG